MASVLCLPAQLACCLGGSAIPLSSSCNVYSNSVNTRCLYGVMLLLTTLMASFVLLPGLEDTVAMVPFCKGLGGPINVDCPKIAGFMAVYRICFVSATFFFGMSFFMLGVKSSRDPRAGIQNSLWIIKFIILIAGWIGAIFIQQGSFDTFCAIIGMAGASVYIIVQVYLIIMFANSWAERWLHNSEESDNRYWLIGIGLCCLGTFMLSLTGIILLYLNYTQPNYCALSKTVISVNLILCVISSFVSILPRIQEYRQSSGLLQSSIVSLYIAYLTWSSVASNPDKTCNQSIFGDSHQSGLNWDSRIGVCIWLILFVLTSLRTASRAKIIVSDSETVLTAEEGYNATKDEADNVQYNWSLFHFFLGCSTLYIMMMLTNWGSPNSSFDTFRTNAAAMRVKLIASWLCILLFNWWNVAPCVCRNRDFSE